MTDCFASHPSGHQSGPDSGEVSLAEPRVRAGPGPGNRLCKGNAVWDLGTDSRGGEATWQRSPGLASPHHLTHSLNKHFLPLTLYQPCRRLQPGAHGSPPCSSPASGPWVVCTATSDRLEQMCGWRGSPPFLTPGKLSPSGFQVSQFIFHLPIPILYGLRGL